MVRTDYRCTCKEVKGTALPATELHWNGGYTNVMPIKCAACGKIHFFPEGNWEIFLAKGDPNTVKEWEDGMLSLCRKRESLVSKIKRFLGIL